MWVGFRQIRCAALWKLPAPRADGIPELLDQPEPLPVVRHHQRVCRLVHHGVDTGAAVRAADIVLPEHQPWVAIDLAGSDAFDEGHPASITARSSVRSHAVPGSHRTD